MPQQTNTAYRGRFAPTPSGPMHFGSLTTAVGSYLQAKANNGEWLIRIEDIDPPRIVKGATDSILRCLDKYGLNWDGPVLYQSSRYDAYRESINSLQKMQLVYPCSCSRKDIAETNINNSAMSVYPGTCRQGLQKDRQNISLRILTTNSDIEFDDLFSGHSKQNVETEVGDFILRRNDGNYAYHLAVVVDDHDQGMTEIIRGRDLIDSTHRQIFLQQLLGLNTPVYGHLPLVIDQRGCKLSKQNKNISSLLESDPLPILFQALVFLNQQPPEDLLTADLDSFWGWAIDHWQSQNIDNDDRQIQDIDS